MPWFNCKTKTPQGDETKIVTVSSYDLDVFIAGDLERITYFTQEFCDERPWGVTITPTNFVFKHGSESGAKIGIVNYPRFPTSLDGLRDVAESLVLHLLDNVPGQKTALISGPDWTNWYTQRKEDLE